MALFPTMLLMVELGRRLGKRRAARDRESARAGLGAVEGAVFGLLGLLVAFTFSGAAARFDTRWQLVVQEANHVGTAWARLDLLPAGERAALRGLFREYLDSRLAVYRSLPDLDLAWKELARSADLQREIWRRAVAACQSEDGRSATMLMLPALNAMFDVTAQRTMAGLHHPPVIIYVMLFLLATGCSVLAGYGMAGARERSLAHQLGFAAVIASVVFVILDLEYPRTGFIRVDAADQVLLDVRTAMDLPEE